MRYLGRPYRLERLRYALLPEWLDGEHAFQPLPSTVYQRPVAAFRRMRDERFLLGRMLFYGTAHYLP